MTPDTNTPPAQSEARRWQKEAYRHLTICGEARFAANYFAHALSRATLYVADVNGEQDEPDSTGTELLADLFGGRQSEMLSKMALHFTVAGECYILGTDLDTVDEKWDIVSVLEATQHGQTWQIDYGNGVRKTLRLSENENTLGTDVLIRVWIPDAGQRIMPDSPFRALLPVLDEIELITRHIYAQGSSRLAGAGVMFVPQEISLPNTLPNGEDEQPLTNDATGFMQLLADNMMTPIEQPDHPSALVPLVVQVPGDMIDKVRLLHFWTDLDDKAQEMRNGAIRRFALGMDLPPEMVLGMSSSGGTGGGRSNGVSHWGAWQIEESTLKMHIQPMLEVICNEITLHYLRPLYDDIAVAKTKIVRYDDSKLRTRPDRSKEALELHDRMLLSDEAALRENGFEPKDLPEDTEVRRRILLLIARGSSTPDQVASAANQVAHITLPDGTGGDGEQTREERPMPSLEDHRDRPRTPEQAALLAACHMAACRALEKVGNRLRSQQVRPDGVPTAEVYKFADATVVSSKVHSLLDGAFDGAADVLTHYTDDVDTVVTNLEDHVRGLVLRRQPLRTDSLAKIIGA